MKKKLLNGTTLTWAAWIGLFCLLCALYGCSLFQTAQSGPANETITEVIADAGAAANAAEAQYNSGAISQTSTNRSVINDLGAAYNDAKTAYLAVLTAETEYQAAVNTQLTSCAPAAGSSATTSGPTCTAATSNVTSKQTALTGANATLSAKVSVLTAKITAVKALSAAN